jgi:hypothetical protein
MTLAEIEILKALDRYNVPYLIIGGHAVFAHGHRRDTNDLDILWLRTTESEKSLALSLADIEAVYITNKIDPATGIEKTMPVTFNYVQINHLMMLWTKSGFLDLFDYVPGHPAQDVNELFKSAVTVDGRKFPSLEWLRKMKEAAGRTKDLLDLESLPKPTIKSKSAMPFE